MYYTNFIAFNLDTSVLWKRKINKLLIAIIDHDINQEISDIKLDSIYNLLLHKAKRLGMDGPEYVWFVIYLSVNKWWKRAMRDTGVNCTEEEILSVMNGYFTLSDIELGINNQTISEWASRINFYSNYKTAITKFINICNVIKMYLFSYKVLSMIFK